MMHGAISELTPGDVFSFIDSDLNADMLTVLAIKSIGVPRGSLPHTGMLVGYPDRAVQVVIMPDIFEIYLPQHTGA